MEKKTEGKELSCIDCGVANCRYMDGEYPDFCLTKNMDQDVFEEAMALYREEENQKSMIAAATTEHDYYGQMTRVEEIAEYAKRMGFTKIGIATLCGAFKRSENSGAYPPPQGI